MSKELKPIISPVSIDLGAKNTGVYFAHYPAGSSIEYIEKEGKVYQLEKDSYTLLMASRTARRHQRRGYDRRQMVKRLFKLIWEKHFELEWDNDVQQTTSFLFNRRGFSFLTEEYDAEILSRFPDKAYDLLPDELKNNNKHDLATALTEWANENEEEVRKRFDVISRKAYCEKIRRCCQEKQTDDAIVKEGTNSVRLGDTPKDIFEELFRELPDLKNRIETEEYTFENTQKEKITAKYNKGGTFNILSFINNNGAEVADRIKRILPQEQKEWLFNPTGSFDLEKSREKLTESEDIDIKLHLRHLAFALHKTLNELQSGGRHRSKYFDEVKNVLKYESHRHHYLKMFCEKLRDKAFKPVSYSEPLSFDNLANLMGHLSNLELKPLRKYFNDEKHKTGDYWDERRLNSKFGNWIIREWRVNPEKDKDKREGKEGDYKKLCEDWKAHEGSVVDFWLKTDPFYTIPPYQDNNNRRPPRCQSLVLNPVYLDNYYSAWQIWLAELKNLEAVQEHLADYEKELQDLKGGKGGSYFSDNVEGKRKAQLGRRTRKDLDARILQFIFDRVKVDDPLKLNDIYSHAKKYRQAQSTDEERKEAKDKLEKAIKESELPDGLKTERNYNNNGVFDQGTLLHLACKYYKTRQKAKEGRVFIHPEYRYVNGRGYENTGRFDDNNHLLTYCNHKPRQKKYQSFYDLAGLLQVAPRDFEKTIGSTGDEQVIDWLRGFKEQGASLEGTCTRAAKLQKEHRGFLRERLRKAVFRHEMESLRKAQKKNKNSLGREDLDKIENYSMTKAPDKDDKALFNLDRNIKNLSCALARSLFGQELKQDDPRVQKFCSVFSFAQIYNIAFTERSGNTTTCAVCSADNAQRMQMIASENIEESHAKAQRLPAIEIRLIDGAVMRMARITGDAIATDKWKKIKGELEAGKNVRVPIITESNRFEFEPGLKEIKGKKLEQVEKKGRSEGQKKLSDSKDDRIREASRGICPYTGDPLGDAGDKDHIIPRSSNWGTLNDEANLLWASDRGNREVKRDNEFSLQNLADQYKYEQFGTANNRHIEEWITEQIGDGEGENFKFGPYRSFINLTPEQQKAFRHALFLVGHPLRNKIINAIDNRTRTFVNGTQRYFAQVLADSLYKKAKTIKKQHLLSFDFFGVEAQDNTRGDGIYDLRNDYEKINDDVFKYAKQEGEKQQAYSHLIDAQLAFVMVADNHKNDGSLSLKIDDSYNVWPVDRDTGEILDRTILGAIQLGPEDMRKKELKRRKAYTVETHHREIIAQNKKPSINYQIHRDSIFKESFFPLLKFRDEAVKKGFNQSNAVNFNANEFSLLLENDFICLTSRNDQYEVWNIQKKTCQQFLMKTGTHGATQHEIKTAKVIDKLAYQTIKKPLEKVLDPSNLKNKPPKTVEEALANWDKCIKKEDFTKDGILLPVYHDWVRLHQQLLKAPNEREFYHFVKHCPLFKNKQLTNTHNKVRKVFSLPVKSDVGSIRLKRKSWDKTTAIQIVAEESLAKYGYDGKGRPHTILSKHSVPRKHYNGIPAHLNLEPLEWKSVPTEEVKMSSDEIDECNREIIAAKIINKDADRCTARITVSSIENLSLPQDRPHWKGKVFCYENDGECKEAEAKDRGDNHHCLSAQWKWFENPFALPRDRREVEIETGPVGKVITFTVSKSSKLRKWLSYKET